jgi:hypothetical protein
MVGVGQAGLRPRGGVDLQAERGEVLGDTVELAVVRERLTQSGVEVVLPGEAVAVRFETARTRVRREACGVDVEDVRRVVRGEALTELLAYVLRLGDGRPPYTGSSTPTCAR